MMTIFHLTKTLSGGGGVYTFRLSEALRRSGLQSQVLTLDDGSLVPVSGLAGELNARYDWALNGTINRRSQGTMLSFHRRQIWNPEVEIRADDILHLHSITGFIGDRGLRHLLRNRSKVFWTAHNPWLFTGGCVAYGGCDRFETDCRCCPLLKFPLQGWSKDELRTKKKFWRDYGVRPIANSQWMAAMMRRSQFFEGMDIPVVPPIVDDIFFGTTNHTKIHQRVEPLITQINTDTSKDAGPCLDKPSGASASDSLTSELADAPVSESPTRSANAPALARLAHGGVVSDGGNQLAESAEILEDRSQAGLQMVNQKNCAIRLANDPSAFGDNSSSVSIREIRGQNAGALAARCSTLDSPMPRWAGGSRFVVGMSARSLTDGGRGSQSSLSACRSTEHFSRR